MFDTISATEFVGVDIAGPKHRETGTIGSVVFRPYFFTAHNEVGRCHVRVVDRSVGAERCSVTEVGHPERSVLLISQRALAHTAARCVRRPELAVDTLLFEGAANRAAWQDEDSKRSITFARWTEGTPALPECIPSARDTHLLRMQDGGIKWQAP